MIKLEVQIPRIVMQTWKIKKLPRHWRPSQDAIKKYMPDWKYVLMTDNDNMNFVEQYFPDFLSCYKNFPYPIQRADAIRYMWFYVNGGLYLDLDIEILKPLDPLFYEYADMYTVKSLFGNWVYTNAFMACQPRSPIMLKCLELMSIPLSFHKSISRHFLVINSTGPNMYTKAIELSLEESEKQGKRLKVLDLPREKIINCDVCGEYDSKEQFIKDVDPYCRNLGGSSWTSSDSQVLIFGYCNRKLLIAMVLTIIVFLIVKQLRRNR